MGLLGYAALHGFVVRVLTGVVAYFEVCWFKGGDDLGATSAITSF